MAHIVTCFYCKERFDRDKYPFVQVKARRYAHAACAENTTVQKTQEEKDLEELEEYIKKLLKLEFVNPRIKKQINDFKKEYNYTYSGMLKSLIYWFELKGNPIEKANGGIGIIPYIYDSASKYYYSLYLANLANQNKDVNEYKQKVREISIVSPRANIKRPELFVFEEDE